MRPSAQRSPESVKAASAVLDAAAKVFARQGYDETSIDDIADELGATKGRVYHYFRTKADLLLGVQISGTGALVETARNLAEDDTLGATERLFQMARAHAMAMMTDHSYQFVSLQIAHDRSRNAPGANDPAWGQVLELRREYQDLFEKVLQAGRASGEFTVTDPRLTMRGILGALNWITVWYDPDASAADNRRGVDQIADTMAAFVVSGAGGNTEGLVS